jgi:hypothetical protein
VKVGDLIRYTYRAYSPLPSVRGNKEYVQIGIITKLGGNTIWFTPNDGNPSTWANIVNVELINASR